MKPMKPYVPMHGHPDPPSGPNATSTGCFKIGGFVGFAFFVLSGVFSAFGSDAEPFDDYAIEEAFYTDEYAVAMDSAAIEVELPFFVACDSEPAVTVFSGPGLGPAAAEDPEEFAISRETENVRLAWLDSFDGVGVVAIYESIEGRPIHAMTMYPAATGWWVSHLATCPEFVGLVPPFTPPTTTTAPPVATGAEPVVVAGPTTTAITTTTTTSIPNGRPVPDVVELTIDDAILTLFDWNLQIKRVSEPSSEVAEGVVIRTEPQAGTQVAPNSVITIVVSSG